MIKVGQIYRNKDRRGIVIVCVTRIRSNGSPYIITTNGTSGTRNWSDFKKYDLLAEYPSWQEAVNSEEFKNGKI